ncbi:MAG: hypothetical protein JW829_20360 [Pirellulales bacterium]|nr:hypothetical protein [Pirellulales bacterium]
MRFQKGLLNFALVSIVAAIGCHAHVARNLPPASQMMHPGPGVGGPGPGVITPASAMVPGLGVGATSQISFLGPSGAEVSWDTCGDGIFDSEPLVMPGRQNFPQGAIYRLKLTNLPGPNRAGIELYPTLEVGPVTPRTDAYLAHAPIPVQFTEEDIDQVLSGNYVTKVIYLPDPEFQELALSGVETLVSMRLDPGVDPIDEADRRGSILAIVRIGNKDFELPSDTTMMGGQVMPVQYTEEVYEEGLEGMGYPNGAIEMNGGMPGMPHGMPTAGFQPSVAPPGVVSGISGPQWGMPYVGTPIGLPGPPHIPLGAPAGLTRHVIKNRTRVHMPQPVDTLKISVKQRPGMSYPRPVQKVRVNEVQREPFRLFGARRGAGYQDGVDYDGGYYDEAYPAGYGTMGNECQTCR